MFQSIQLSPGTPEKPDGGGCCGPSANPATVFTEQYLSQLETLGVKVDGKYLVNEDQVEAIKDSLRSMAGLQRHKIAIQVNQGTGSAIHRAENGNPTVIGLVQVDHDTYWQLGGKFGEFRELETNCRRLGLGWPRPPEVENHQYNFKNIPKDPIPLVLNLGNGEMRFGGRIVENGKALEHLESIAEELLIARKTDEEVFALGRNMNFRHVESGNAKGADYHVFVSDWGADICRFAFIATSQDSDDKRYVRVTLQWGDPDFGGNIVRGVTNCWHYLPQEGSRLPRIVPKHQGALGNSYVLAGLIKDGEPL